jgi:hypothetical protein
MKNFTLLLIVAISCIFYYSCDNVNASKPASVPASAEEKISNAADLEELGFSNSKSIRELRSNAIGQKYKEAGLNFVSTIEIETFAETNNLKIGPTRAFIGEIPEASSRQIIDNYKKVLDITKDTRMYITPDGRFFTEKEFSALRQMDQNWILELGKSPSQLMVVAEYKDFQRQQYEVSGIYIEPKIKDPIVLYPVDGGYIKLAEW